MGVTLQTSEFGIPTLLAADEPTQILPIGVAPDRIDILVSAGRLDFDGAWSTRLVSGY